MRIIRLLPLGVLVAGGLGVGCDNATGVSDTSADLQMSKSGSFESIVAQDNFVSNIPIPGDRDVKIDPDLVNAWGLVFADSGFAWVNANHSGTDRIYDSKGNLRGVVTLPLTADQKAMTPPGVPAPTGQVVNTFPKAFKGDDFIVVSEDGVVTGIKVKGMKKNMVDADAKIRFPLGGERLPPLPENFKGVALSTINGKPFLFLADFRNALVSVLDENYNFVGNATFVDKNLTFQEPDPMNPKNKITIHFAPFNILAVPGERLIVTYAVQGEGGDDDVAGAGHGLVNIFDTNGNLIERLLTGPNGKHPELNSPWGMQLSAEKNEKKSTDLILGNFGDGHINVYELTLQGKLVRADFEGQLGTVKNKKVQPLVISGLWGLMFGNDKGGFNAADLYFAAGPDNGPGTDLETNGLFGELSFVSPRN